MTEICRLRCESMKNPLGITICNPRLSWIIKSDERNVKQEIYRVIIKKAHRPWANNMGNCLPDLQINEVSEETIYDTGRIRSSDNFVALPGIFNESGKRYYWEVHITDNSGKEWKSGEAWFETGLFFKKDWQARWIEPKQNPVFRDIRPAMSYDEPDQSMEIDEAKLSPCQMIRREFCVTKEVKAARVYATAHGIYRLMINGIRAGDYELAPEATAYNTYLQVQTYDVTELLERGNNAAAVVLSTGWWAGRIGHYGESVQYGDRMGLLMQIHILYEDGTETVIGTDESFLSSEGERRYGELCIGEKYDMNMEKKGWQFPGYDDRQWQPSEVCDYSLDNLTGQNAQPIRVLEELDDVDIFISPREEQIIDCRQVMAGNASMRIKAEPGAEVKLRYFETTDAQGNYWFELGGRNSQQTDTFVLDESGEGIYDPWFTYHAFRYIYVSGDTGNVEVSDIHARLIASDIEVTAQIETSNEKVNRLQKNIEWTLRSNMTSILTDNPDRERAGWTGDLQMIAPTLCYNLDTVSFLQRWLIEAAQEQRENGEIPLVIPNWPHYENMPMKSSAGWGDVVVIVPWIIYKRYGNKKILEECYPMMKKWVDFQKDRAENANPEDFGEITPERRERLRYLWNADFNFGDWLTPSACYDERTGTYTYYTQTLCYMMGTYYYAYTTSIMAKISEVLGLQEEAVRYNRLNEKIREAAVEEFYKKGLILESEYMGAQILALHMGFYPEGDKKKLLDRILELIGERGMDTGFSSVLLISDLLCDNGYSDIAYDFLLNESFPSWLYEVDQGATSVWESMQAIMPDGTRNAVSFIQPAFCSIGNWMMERMGGIRAAEPGFRKSLIYPYFTKKLDFAEARYLSEQGEIKTRWERNEDEIKMDVVIPANATAIIFLAGADEKTVKESGVSVDHFEGLSLLERHKDGLYVHVGSGTYHFEYAINI